MFKLSSEASLDGVVTVENKFIVEYMPYADGDYVKVYLYGLSLAARKTDPDDTVERLSRRLNLDRATVDAAIEYWTELGLMARLGDDITYFSTRTSRPKIKKYDVDKYSEFNRQAQEYISARQIEPREYDEYYALMERFELEWTGMAAIVKYCVNLKGNNVSCPYILAVARNLAQDGYRTYDDIEAKLEEFGVYYNDLCAVMGAMGGKRPDHETVQLYKKWLNVYKFDKSIILGVAQTIKRGGAATLDAKLTAYHELGLSSLKQIEYYETERKDMAKLAKSVNKALGVYYENTDPEIASYIRPWLGMGFEGAALVAIADYCMKNNLKTLSDLDAVVREFFAASVTTEKQVKARIAEEKRYDAEIEKVMSALGIMGAVKPAYRAYYSTWREKWNLPDDVIDYAASSCAGKPLAYLNGILQNWHGAGVTTLDAAKAQGAAKREVAATGDRNADVLERYTADELNSLLIKLSDDD